MRHRGVLELTQEILPIAADNRGIGCGCRHRCWRAERGSTYPALGGRRRHISRGISGFGWDLDSKCVEGAVETADYVEFAFGRAKPGGVV